MSKKSSNKYRSARLEAYNRRRDVYEKHGITADIVDDPYERQMQRLNSAIKEVRKSASKGDNTSLADYFGLRAFQSRLMLVYMDETD